jgi:hypothetical protein
MTVQPPSELEFRIAEKARAEGISAEEYVERVIRKAAETPDGDDLALPVWPGRGLNDLRREDLYDDAR